MMKNICLLISLVLFSGGSAMAQEELQECKVFLGEETYHDLTVEQALNWAEVKPLSVQCDDGNIYELNKLNFRIILQDPFRNKDFGTTEGGLPLLGIKMLKEAKNGDSVLLMNPTYLAEDGSEKELPNIVFKIVSDSENLNSTVPQDE